MAMNRVGVAVLAVLGLSAGAVVLYKMTARRVPVPERERVWIPENVVVLDSTQVSGSPKAYLFRYDAGAFGYSVKMVSLERPSHEHAVLRSDQVRAIRWKTPDTLTIDLVKGEYELVGTPQGITVVPHVLSGPGQ